tara:strand:+ start:2561 stop:5104 length:2544 start_codon:yes stop_codon:yes gene_type:complete
MADYIPSFYRFVKSITVTAGGTGYNNTPTISITGGGGTGATATATTFSGAITSYVITNKGTGFTSTPTIVITPNALDTTATGATASAILDAANDSVAVEDNNTFYLKKDQLPEIVQNEYPLFATFIEKYYQFMDEVTSPSSKIHNHTQDIDLASEEFLDKWRGALTSDFPKLLKVDRSLFYKRAKDFYESKGSKRSIETFFRVMYDENVDIIYPYQYTLKPSDGIYSVERAIKIQESEHGGGSLEPLDLEGKKIDIRFKETTGTVTVTKTLNASVTRVEKNTYQTNGLTLQRYELICAFDDPSTLEVEGPGAGAVATSTVSSGSLTAITVTNQGGGYNSAPVIEIFPAAGDAGTGATAHALVSGGKLTSIVIDNAGTGYSAAPNIEFDIDDVKTYVVDDGAANNESDIYGYVVRVLTGVAYKSYSGSEINAGFKIGQIFAINEAGDDGKSYAVNGYFDDDYTFIGGSNDAYIRVTSITTAGLPSTFAVINPGSTFTKASVDINITSPAGEVATITLTTGYLFEYEGKWKNDQGKLSDVNVLQDNKRYQPFSYVIKSGIEKTTWERPLKNAVHPAGMQVFGDLIVKSYVDFNVEFTVTTAGTLYYVFKSTDQATTSDVLGFIFTSSYTDAATSSETIAKHVAPGAFTSVAVAADTDSSPYVLTGYWNDSSDSNFEDDYNRGNPAFFWSMAKALSETAATTDNNFTLQYSKVLSSIATTSDSLAFGYWPIIEDGVSVSDALTYTKTIILSGLFDSGAFDTTATATTSEIISFGKNINEALGATDTLGSINTSKGITETPATTEHVVKALTLPSVVDSGTTSDAGLGVSQDYLDPSYIAGDLVGTSWTFT